jgi:flagellin
LAEVERIGAQTSFNGLKVLDGTFGTSQFQVGANVGETITINLSQGVKASQVGQIATGTSSVEVTTAALTGTATLQVGSGQAATVGISVQGTEAGQSVGSAYAKAAAINAASVPGLTATATNTIELDIGATTGTAVGDLYSLTVNGTVIFGGYNQNTNGVLTAQQLTDGINSQSSNTGVTAVLVGGSLRLTAADGRDINIGQTVAGATAGGIAAGTGGATTVNGVTYRDGTIGTVANATAYATDATAVNGGTITLTAAENIVLTGDGTLLGFANANETFAKDTSTIASTNVLNVAAANDTIQRIDSALTAVSGLRSTFGAIQNRFESTIANLTAISENLSASRSRIQDADFAAETAALTRAQILQQAGIAILAQANAAPQTALALLQ